MTATDDTGKARDRFAPRELRIAITMNGGVSLAVYMGGAAHEFNELTKTTGNYHALLELLGHKPLPVIDVLAGTSAGGINAAALALAQANDTSVDLSIMKTLWIEDGQIGSLLRTPFQAGPPSLMRGDEYFLPKIQSALRRLVTNFARGGEPRSVDLTIAATLLTPVNLRTTDDLGTGLLQAQHAGLFHFRGHGHDAAPSNPSDATGGDVFAKDRIDETVEAIALSARASAGFPVAFEPTFIPVGDKHQLDRPDMAKFADWAKDEPTESRVSRFAVDGGILANTPTRPTLDAIRRRAAAERLVRRVLILVHPHATDASTARPVSDRVTQPPTLVASLAGVLGASSSVGSRSYVEDIESHNERALRWRDGRFITLKNFSTAQALRGFLGPDEGTGIPWTLFHSMRLRRSAYVLAHQVRDTTSIPLADLVKLGEEVIEKYIISSPSGAVNGTEDTNGQGVNGADSPRRDLPFLPGKPPQKSNLEAGSWRWGLDLAVGIARLATDLLGQLVDRPRVQLREQGAHGAASRPPREPDPQAAWEMATIAQKRAITARMKIEALGEAEERAAREANRADGAPAGDASPTEGTLEDGYGIVQSRLERNLYAYESRVNQDSAEVDTLLREEVVKPLLDVIRAIKRSGQSSTDADREGELLGDNPFKTARSVQQLLTRMLTVEVISYLLTEDGGAEGSAPSSPIDFVQLSAQVPQHFAPDFTSDDKLAGMSLNRFGAFLKRSWRANDWIWGRLDGIKILMQVILTPDSIRGLVRALGATPGEDIAAKVVNAIGLAAFDRTNVLSAESSREKTQFAKFLTDAEATALYDRAKREVAAAISEMGSDAPLKELASLAAYGPQIAAAAEDVPWLAETILDDRRDGATGTRSASFLSRFGNLRDQHPDAASTASGHRLLKLFTESKIGQEDVGDELPSDLMIRTAATAAATVVTMIGAERSGLNVVKPAGKLLRGVVAVPYWTVVGLTHRGQLARVAAATMLALGVSLIALSLLAPLSGLVSALVPTLGVGSLLTVFAYAALRSRSMVHGAALLGLFIPLLALAAHRLWARSGTNGASVSDTTFRFTLQESGFAIVAVLVLIAGTIVIANINVPLTSPLARLRKILDSSGKLKAAACWIRDHLKLAGIVIVATALLLWAVAVVSFGEHLLWSQDSWLRGLSANNSDLSYTIIGLLLFFAPVVGILCHGFFMGKHKASELRPHPAMALTACGGAPAPQASSSSSKPDTVPSTNPALLRLRDPAGLAIAWAGLYGGLYTILAVVIVGVHKMSPPTWAVAASASAVVLGYGFAVVAIWVIPLQRERRLTRRLSSAFAITADPKGEALVDSRAVDKAALAIFRRIGEDSDYLITNEKTLSDRGRKIAVEALRRARELDSERRL